MKSNEIALWSYEDELVLMMEDPKSSERKISAKKPVQYSLLIGDGNQGLLMDELDMASMGNA